MSEYRDNAKSFSGSGRILIMDDDDMLRDAAGRILAGFGYEVEYSRTGTETLTRYREASECNRPFAAVIMDLTVPGGMGGRETLGKLREFDPEVRTIVASGYSSDPVLLRFREYGFNGMIIKPFTARTLAEAVRDVIASDTGGV